MPRIIPRLIPIAALIFGMACNTDTGEEAVAEQQSDEAADVTISSCGTDSFGAGTLAATLAITNNSSKRSNYSAEVVFESPDGATRFGSAWTYVDNVEPGQSTTGEALAVEAAPAGEYTCRLLEIDRMSDVG
ncbi:MAG: hypothetical protein ACRDZV_12160 [Acidimicrobiia bacterium]